MMKDHKWNFKLEEFQWGRKKAKKKPRSHSKGKSRKKKHRENSSPSISSTSSNEPEEKQPWNYIKDSIFKIVVEEDWFKYKLSPDMTQYASTNSTRCIKEVDLILDLTKVVLVENSVLDNINEVK